MPSKPKAKPGASKPKSQPKRPKTKQNKTKIWLIIGGIIAVLAVLVVVIVLILGQSSKTTEDSTPDQPNHSAEVDFNQKVTDANGNTFQETYQLGTKSNFSVRFADLTCATETCENVQDVTLDGKSLIRSQDYEVRKGSIIITLLASTLETLKAGQYNLIFKVIDEDSEYILVGVKITITDQASSNQSSDQTSEETTKQPSSSTTNQANQTTQTTKPAQSTSTPSKTEQQLCEEKTAPYRVLTVTWLTDAEKAQYKEIFAVDPNDPDRVGFEEGDEIAISGSGYSGAKMKWVNNSCQISLSEADPIGMGGGDWLVPRTDNNFPSEIRSNPNRNAAIWYFSDGSHQTVFVNGDPWSYINSLTAI